MIKVHQILTKRGKQIKAKFVFNDGKVFAGGYDLSSNITSVNLDISADELDATTINSGGFKSKLGGIKDSTLQLDGFYEAGANKPVPNPVLPAGSA